MTDQPSRVTPGEISALLDQARQLTPDTDPGERLAYFDRKADLLTRVAADLGTLDSHEVAAAARAYAAALRSGLDPATLDGVPQ
jgi:hypothetical protein